MQAYASVELSNLPARIFYCFFKSSKTIKIPAGKCDSYIYAYVANESTPRVLGSGHHLSPGGGGGVGAEDFEGDHTVFKKTEGGIGPN